VKKAMPGGIPDRDALAAMRDRFLTKERPGYVTDAIRVCPFAGYLDDEVPTAPTQGRVGCMIHPVRMTNGEDHRDLAVYDRAICAGHFCASHEWLRPVEVALAQATGGTLYGRVVTDAGLVKALRTLLEEQLGRPLKKADAQKAKPAIAVMFHALLIDWPWASKDPQRFGGVVVDDDGVRERTVSSDRFARPLGRSIRALLDAAATEVESDHALDEALRHINDLIAAITHDIECG